MLPCVSSKNSTSFLPRTSSGISPEYSPSDRYTCRFKFISTSHPPIISFFRQHVSPIPHLQIFRTLDHSEDPFNFLQPPLSAFGIVRAFEKRRIVPLKTVQLPVSANNSSIGIPSQHTSNHAQSLSDRVVISSSSSGHCSAKYQTIFIRTRSIDSVNLTPVVYEGLTDSKTLTQTTDYALIPLL